MRRFDLFRDEDVSGVSGTGKVAEGVEFTDGAAVIRWLGQWPTTVHHDYGLESIINLHGHGGKTRVEFID